MEDASRYAPLDDHSSCRWYMLGKYLESLIFFSTSNQTVGSTFETKSTGHSLILSSVEVFPIHTRVRKPDVDLGDYFVWLTQRSSFSIKHHNHAIR